jgi:fructose-1,6-bisphosphatase II
MDRNLALEFVRVTEAAALSCGRLMGRGDETAADQAAVDAMRRAFDSIPIQGEIVIGEGERDEAPMLFIGEKVGRAQNGDAELAIACDPLEGTTICATGGAGSISVIAIAEKGGFLRAPDCYMEKIAVGPACRGVVDLNKSPTENLRAVADAKGVYVEDLTVVILNRPRHERLIKEVRQAGARIKLIGDGDVSAGVATCFADSGVDVLMGIGGAPEGVIAAAALAPTPWSCAPRAAPCATWRPTTTSIESRITAGSRASAPSDPKQALSPRAAPAPFDAFPHPLLRSGAEAPYSHFRQASCPSASNQKHPRSL